MTISQIFICHRGVDTKKTLASLIYQRLTQVYGLHVFLDEEELHTGDSLNHAIQEAINSAFIHIVIFSEHFAESHWCLDELRWILTSKRERQTRIIPVFYYVQPSDLRQTEKKPYADAFEYHQRKGRDIVEKWKGALTEASLIPGVVYETEKGDYGKDLEMIVKDILVEVFKRQQLDVPTYPVGLEQEVKEFQSKIKKYSELNHTMIMGITGMTGAGKSVLARCFCNLIRPDFSRFCFLPVDRASKDKLPSLQDKLFYDLLGISDTPGPGISRGKSILRESLLGLRVLIVLDDVDRIEHINSLLDIETVGPGSVILITSCDKELLGSASRRLELHEVKLLQEKHARELFCWNAFSQREPEKGFKDLVNKFLTICGGLPYSLNLLGAQLRGNTDIMHWHGELEKYSTTPAAELKEKLMVCYEGLTNEEKEMLLDIGCFFVGEDRELALQVLEGIDCYRDELKGFKYYNSVSKCLESLRQKCLVEYHEDVQSHQEIVSRREEPIGNYDLYIPPPKRRDKITMHNQVVQLVRDITEQEFYRLRTANPLRLSCSSDVYNIQSMLQLQSQGAVEDCAIRGFRIDQSVPGNGKKKIKGVGVSLFVVERPIDLSSFFGLWDIEGALVWLRLRNVLSVCFPHTISMGRLRVLEIQGGHRDLDELLDCFPETPSDLRELSIHVMDTPPSTSSSRRPFDHEHTIKGIADNAQQGKMAPSTSLFNFIKDTVTACIKLLQKVELKNIASLSSLPFDCSELENLRHLDLSGCTNLIQLPKSFSKLMHLKYLALRDCKNLSIPTDILGEISTLEHVDFKGCVGLVKLPGKMAIQKSLRYLNLLQTNLLQLPTNLELCMLEQLRIGSPQLTELPHSLGRLMRLEELILLGCHGLISSEKVAGPNIKVLVIEGSPLTNFSFQDQATMNVGMPILRDFTLKNTSISEICIPDGAFPYLETVDLSSNCQLMQVNGLPSRLVRLNMENCDKLDTINLLNMVNLKFLNVSECPQLEALNVEAVTSLEEIKAVACWKLKKLEGLSQGGQFNRLCISTDEGLIWNDICKFLTLSPPKNISTAIFSGKADDKEMSAERAVRCIVNEKFKLQMVDIVADATRLGSHLKIENFHSQNAMLMCFISSTESERPFRVKFDASDYGGPVQEYKTLRGNGSGKSLDVFMWREDSDLFQEYKDCSNIDVYCCDLCVSERDGEHGERGWMVMVDNNTDVAEVCIEFIDVFTSKEPFCLSPEMEGLVI